MMGKTVQVTFTGVETPKRLQNAADARRGIVRHTFDVPAGSLATEVLLTLDGPNPRTPNIHRKAAKGLKESLQGVDPSTVGAFHLAHSGIRGIVKSLKRIDETTYRATFEVETGSKSEDHGIANGLHTIAVAQAALEEGEIPPDQYINVTLIENVERELVPYIGEGLNTNIQVAEESIINLGGAFDPFKSAIAGMPYSADIGWHENQAGDYDARDVFAVLTALNVARYPNGDRDRHPIEAYEKQSKCIEAFKLETENASRGEGGPQTYQAMIPLLTDGLFLHDLIRAEAGDRYRDARPEGKPGGLAIMEKRFGKDGTAKPDLWRFAFLTDGAKPSTRRGTYRLAKGVTFAMLASFRNFVEYDEDGGVMQWAGGFDNVVQAWNSLGGDMMVAANDVSQSVNYNPTAVGKNRPLWRTLHQMVASYRLQKETDELRLELAAMKAGAKRS
jgi:hypothetical protein